MINLKYERIKNQRETYKRKDFRTEKYISFAIKTDNIFKKNNRHSKCKKFN